MSFSRLNYDSCAYDKTINESMSIGDYMLKDLQPKNCFVSNPTMRSSSVPVCENRIDIDSELIGLKRTASKCTESKMPTCKVQPLNDCKMSFHSEDTKLSNPPCTLRGTGWNRWDWLCEDPQKSINLKFPSSTNDKQLAKDNYMPLIPNVSNTTNFLTDDMDCLTEISSEKFTKDMTMNNPNFVHWRSCEEIKKM